MGGRNVDDVETAQPPHDRATSRTLVIVEDPDSVMRQAVAAGATETSPVQNEHGWRLGRIVDPFGHEWEIGVPPEPGPELGRRTKPARLGGPALRSESS